MRFRCPTCDSEVEGIDVVCGTCGTQRPAHGWVRVTELVVHGGFRDEQPSPPEIAMVTPSVRPSPRSPSQPPSPAPAAPPISMPSASATGRARPSVHRTVYLEAPASPQAPVDPDGRHTLGLAATFLTTFMITTAVVLVTWAANPARETRGAPVGEAASVVPERPGTALPRPHDDSVGSVDLDEMQTLLEPEPTPTGLAPAVPIAQPDPAPVPRPRTAPGAQSGTRSEVRAQDSLSGVLADLNGKYSGMINRAPVTFSFSFLAGGVVEATIKGEGSESRTTRGTYRLEGRTAIVRIAEQGESQDLVYTGRVTRFNASGQVTSSSGEVLYFSAQR